MKGQLKEHPLTTTYPIPGYPAVVLAEDMEQVIVRPMQASDEQALLDFFRRIPEQDRMHLKEDVTSEHVIHRWATEINFNRTIPLLAFVSDRVVADGTLHHRRAGTRKHIGEIRVVVEPEFRNKGVGRALVRRLIEMARDEGIEKLVFELVEDGEQAARHTAKLLGFVPIAVLAGHSRDSFGNRENVIIMELDVAASAHVPNVF
jgi:GNAT superfamily N-acetyltransferase